MAITFDIELDVLRRPQVAQAVANLMQAISQSLATPEVPVPAVSATPKARAVAVAPEPEVAAPAPAAPRAPAPPPRAAKERAPKAAPKAKAPAPEPAPRAAAKAAVDVKPMSFTDFVAALPVTTQRFLQLVKTEGTLTRSRAIDGLGLDSGKQLGGLTGAIAKWAPRRGLAIPYETIELNGERAWRWTGPREVLPVAEAPAAPAPAPVEEAPTVRPPIRRRPKAEAAPSGPTRPTAPSPRAGSAGKRAAEFDTLLAALPTDAARFMRTLRNEGRLSSDDAMAMFGFERPRQLGAIIEPIRRIGRDLGIAQPFEDERAADGKKVWRWPS